MAKSFCEKMMAQLYFPVYYEAFKTICADLGNSHSISEIALKFLSQVTDVPFTM